MILSNTTDLHKFSITSDIETHLSKEIFYILTEVGLPLKILSNKFHYFDHVQLVNNELILGESLHVRQWKLKIKLTDGSIFIEGKGDNSDFVSIFLNSSLNKLIHCLNTYYFYLSPLIKDNFLGDYSIHHEKYAALLSKYIGDIDSKATEIGIWWSLIDDMDVGIL